MREEDEGLNEFAVARHEAAALKARQDRVLFWGGILLGVISAAAAVSGIINHDDIQMVGGLLFGAVAFKIIPFAEAAKLWPWSKER